MTSLALRASELADAPKLRLQAADDDAGEQAAVSAHVGSAADRPALHVSAEVSSHEAEAILVAGSDSAQREAVLDDLSDRMPQHTTFEQAGEVWQVLARAPSSRMVVLSGELDDAPTDAVMRMLGHRHPGLPVVSLAAPALA